MGRQTKRAAQADKSFLGTEPLAPLMVKLALPAIASQLVALLYNVVDRVFVGHIPDAGVDALTGLGICLPIIAIVQAFGTWVGTGAGPLGGIVLGSGDAPGAKRVVGNAVVMLIIATAFVMIVIYAFAGDLLMLFGASTQTLPYALTYLQVFMVGAPFLLAANALSMFLLAQGGSREVFIANGTSSVLNIVLDALFIFGFGWGIMGAAVATVVAEIECAVLTIWYLQQPDSAFRIEKEYLALQAHTVKRTLSIGIGRFFISASEGILLIVLNAQMQAYGGDVYVAALTILETLLLIGHTFASGFTQGTQGILSYCVGARLTDRVYATMKALISMAFILQFVMVGLIIIFARPIAGCFTTDAEVIDLISSAAFTFMFGMLLFGAQLGIQCVFTAFGFGIRSLLLAAMRKVVFFIPLAFILPPHFGAWGVFMAEPISDTMSVCFAFVMFFATRKKFARVLAEGTEDMTGMAKEAMGESELDIVGSPEAPAFEDEGGEAPETPGPTESGADV